MATVTEFNDEIKGSLGGKCLVDVELVDEDYALCFKKAKRAFQQRGHNNFRRVFAAIDVTTDVRTYDLPPETGDVVRVIRPSVGFSNDDIFGAVVYNELFQSYGTGSCGCSSGSGGSTGFDLLTYELTKQRMESMERYSATEIDFQYDRFTKKITFFGSAKANGKYFVDMYQNLTDDEYREIDWIVRWSIAEAKAILGTAYDKFNSLPSPSGETNLGGAELRRESQAEKDALNLEILEFVDGDVDYMQITFG